MRPITWELPDFSDNVAEASAVAASLLELASADRFGSFEFFTTHTHSLLTLELTKRASTNIALIHMLRKHVSAMRMTRSVKIQHVRGHNGLTMNEMADRVADAARRGLQVMGYPVRPSLHCVGS